MILILFSLTAKVHAAVEPSVFDESIRLYQAGEYQESAALLKTLILHEPQKSLYWFNYANAQFMMKSYERALKAFDRVIQMQSTFVAPARLYRIKTLRQMGLHDQALLEATSLSSDLNSELSLSFQSEQEKLERLNDQEELALVEFQEKKYEQAENRLRQNESDGLSTQGRLLLALTYIRQKKFYQSETLLNQLSQSARMTAEEKNTIAELLRKSRQRESDGSPYILGVDLSTGYFTNVYGDGKSINPTATTFTRANLGLGYHFNQGAEFSQKVLVNLSYENPKNAPDLLTTTQNAQFALMYQSNGFETSAAPSIQSQVINSVSSTRKIGAAFKNAYSSDFFELGIDYDIYDVKSLSTEYNYLAGTSSQVKPYLGFWSNSFFAQLSWIQGQDGAQDLIFTDGSRLPITQVFQGPSLRSLWKLSDQSSVSFGVTYLQHDFKNLSLPSPKKRKDQEFTGYFKKSYLFLEHFSVYGQFDITSNTSTFGSNDVRDKNYDAYTFSIGLTLDAF